MKHFVITEKELKKIIKSSIVESMDELIAYHGTNTDFNKFDTAYMSSGWGQQAYGYGFYLTSSFQTAKEYAYKSEGQVMEVEIPDGKYLTDKSISKSETERISRIFFKFMTQENEDTKEMYPDNNTKQAFWDYEVKYIRHCVNGCYVYNTIVSLMGDTKDTSNFLHDKCGYIGLKIKDEYTNSLIYVIFDPSDMKIINKHKI